MSSVVLNRMFPLVLFTILSYAAFSTAKPNLPLYQTQPSQYNTAPPVYQSNPPIYSAPKTYHPPQPSSYKLLSSSASKFPPGRSQPSDSYKLSQSTYKSQPLRSYKPLSSTRYAPPPSSTFESQPPVSYESLPYSSSEQPAPSTYKPSLFSTFKPLPPSSYKPHPTKPSLCPTFRAVVKYKAKEHHQSALGYIHFDGHDSTLTTTELKAAKFSILDGHLMNHHLPKSMHTIGSINAEGYHILERHYESPAVSQEWSAISQGQLFYGNPKFTLGGGNAIFCITSDKVIWVEYTKPNPNPCEEIILIAECIQHHTITSSTSFTSISSASSTTSANPSQYLELRELDEEPYEEHAAVGVKRRAPHGQYTRNSGILRAQPIIEI